MTDQVGLRAISRVLVLSFCLTSAVAAQDATEAKPSTVPAAPNTNMSPTDINTASQAELEMVVGIGPDLSGRILASRHERPFRDWADVIARIKGIGRSRAQKLSLEGLRVAGLGYLPEPARH